MNNWKLIKNEGEYKEALSRTIHIFHAEPGTPEYEELKVLLVLVKDYEAKHIIVPELNSIDVVR